MRKASRSPWSWSAVSGRGCSSQPLLQGAVEALKLAEGLGMVGAGVDELHPEGGEAPFELHPGADQTAGETGRVVAQELARQTVAADGPLEALPGGLAGGAVSDPSGQAEPGMVVEDVHHPALFLVAKQKARGVDLPQVIGRGTLETFCGGGGGGGGWGARGGG